MKKYFVSFLLLMLVPGMCLGASARYTQLVREKQNKMEELEKCMGSTKGLKIAGVSTLGLTAAGVAANIYEAKTIKTNEKTIEKNDKRIKTAQEEVDDLTAKKAKREADAKVLAECKKELKDDNITSAEKDEVGSCKVLDCKTGYDVDNGGTSCVKKTTPATTETTETESKIEDTNLQETDNIAAKCTKDFAGADDAYRTFGGAEFCTSYDWDSKEIVSGKCDELGLNLCELKPNCEDNDQRCKELNSSFWVCSTDCSVIPTDYYKRPDWLRPDGNL